MRKISTIKWSDLEKQDGVRTIMGYSLKACERWWLVVLPDNGDVDDISIWCGTYWLVGELDENTILYDYHSARIVAGHINAYVFNLSDYWRNGDVVERDLKHPSSLLVANRNADKQLS